MGARRAALPPLPLLAVAILVALVALIPVIFVTVYAISVGWNEAHRLIFRPRVGELMSNTVQLTAATLPLCAILGTTTAWLVERTALPGRHVWAVLLAAPLAIPAFVNSFAWVSVTTHVNGLGGAVLIVTLSYFPLVYLPVRAALRGLDPALEESARSLGLGPWRTFWRVVVPQLRPAVLGGMLLVGLHLLAEFGALQMLRFPTFTTAIYDQYQSTYNGPAANSLAMVLVGCCAVLLVGDLILAGRARYARLGGGAARPPMLARPGALMPAALLYLAVVTFLSLGVPGWSLAFWMITGASTGLAIDRVVATAVSSIELALIGGLITTLLALPVAWISVRHRGMVTSFIERATYIGHAMPGIVIALSLVAVSIQAWRPLYQTYPLLITAYVISFLPLATVSIRAALMQAPPALDEAARALGAGPIATLRRVTVPLIAGGLGTSTLLVFLAVVTELTATLLLAPIGTETLATRFWSHADSVAYGAAAPYAVLMVLLSAPATYLLTRETVRGHRE